MGVTYVVNVGCGLLALQLVNVPMFFCLRRLVAPVVLIYEYLTMGKVADRRAGLHRRDRAGRHHCGLGHAE